MKKINKMTNKTKCKKCGKKFDIVMASCGSDIRYSLLKCPHCGYLYKEKIPTGHKVLNI